MIENTQSLKHISLDSEDTSYKLHLPNSFRSNMKLEILRVVILHPRDPTKPMFITQEIHPPHALNPFKVRIFHSPRIRLTWVVPLNRVQPRPLLMSDGRLQGSVDRVQHVPDGDMPPGIDHDLPGLCERMESITCDDHFCCLRVARDLLKIALVDRDEGRVRGRVLWSHWLIGRRG